MNYSEERDRQPKCVMVSMGCARPNCKLAFSFYLVSLDYFFCRESGDDIDLDGDIVGLIRDGWFKGKCPRGHELGMLPRELYKVTQHSGSIPSQHEDLHWVKHSSRLIGVETGSPRKRRNHRLQLRPSRG